MVETAVILIDEGSRSMYDTKILGMTVIERMRKTLERLGVLKVHIIENKKDYLLKLKDEITNSFIVLINPVTIIEKKLEIKDDSNIIFTSNRERIGAYILKKDFFDILETSNNIKLAIEKYLNEKGKSIEINAIKLENTDDLKKAEKALLNSLIKMEKTLLSGSKPAYFDGIISRNINRKISLKISKYLASTSITPNQISIISFLISVAGSSLFLLNSHITTLIGGLLIQFSSIVDGCDCKTQIHGIQIWCMARRNPGQIRRLRHSFLYDNECSGIRPVLGSYRLLAAFAVFIIPYTGDKYVAAYKETYVDRGFFISMTRDVRMFLVMLGAIFNSLSAVLIIFAVLGNLESIRRIIVLRSS